MKPQYFLLKTCNEKIKSILYSCVIYQKRKRKKQIQNNNIIDNNHNAYMVIQCPLQSRKAHIYVDDRMACNNLLADSGHHYQMYVQS